MKRNIEFLFEKPELTKICYLTIQPLAPLSMVSSMPGSYYKTEYIPTKFMLCGLFESILDLHLSVEIRNRINQKQKQIHKKEYRQDYDIVKSAVGYLPIIYHLFEILDPTLIPEMIYFEDLWTQHLIAGDRRHMNGVINNDWRIDPEIRAIKKKNIEKEKDKGKELDTFFKEHKNFFPVYYRSPKQREFLYTEGEYLLKLRTTQTLYEGLSKAIIENNLGYLGTSEGWINLDIREYL